MRFNQNDKDESNRYKLESNTNLQKTPPYVEDGHHVQDKIHQMKIFARRNLEMKLTTQNDDKQ